MMVLQFPLTITKPMSKGVTLLEMLVVLFVISLMTLQLTLIYKPYIEPEGYHLIDRIKLAQITALATTKTMELNELKSNVSRLSYNDLGNVNQAQTLNYEHLVVVIQLGMGRYEIP